MSAYKWIVENLNNIFVETGSGKGKGINCALNCGFKRIYSIEIDESRHNKCKKAFQDKPNVRLYLGDSLEILPIILPEIDDVTTFLLDAHIGNMSEKHGKIICPIIQEINMVLKHGVERNLNHTLVIDDSSYFSGKKEEFQNLTLLDLENVIREIRPLASIKTNHRCIVVT